MNITLHQLQVLKAIKIHGSLTVTARALHITQPAVSNILKQLSHKFQYPLTETIGKRIYLTPAGEHLVKAADDIQTILESTLYEINGLHGHLSGQIDIAIVSTAKYFMPKLLGEFKKKHPKVAIKLTVCNRQEAIYRLKHNAHDFIIMSQPPDNMAIKQQLFYPDELVVVASPEMIFQSGIDTLADLSAVDWIIREPGSGTRIVMEKLFKKHRMLPNISMEVGSNESIKQLIMANMGISIVSKQSIELELGHQLMKILPIKQFPLNHPWYVVMNKGKALTQVTRAFFKHVDL